MRRKNQKYMFAVNNILLALAALLCVPAVYGQNSADKTLQELKVENLLLSTRAGRLGNQLQAQSTQLQELQNNYDNLRSNYEKLYQANQEILSGSRSAPSRSTDTASGRDPERERDRLVKEQSRTSLAYENTLKEKQSLQLEQQRLSGELCPVIDAVSLSGTPERIASAVSMSTLTASEYDG